MKDVDVLKVAAADDYCSTGGLQQANVSDCWTISSEIFADSHSVDDRQQLDIQSYVLYRLAALAIARDDDVSVQSAYCCPIIKLDADSVEVEYGRWRTSVEHLATSRQCSNRLSDYILTYRLDVATDRLFACTHSFFVFTLDRLQQSVGVDFD